MSDIFDQYREQILAPLDEETPCGVDLRWDDAYDKIKEARRQDDDLPMGEWQPLESKRADWHRVEALSLSVLSERSKDLQIAVWLTEAWVRLHGMPGLRAGIEMLDGLCDTFWDGLYPLVDDIDTERRLAPLYGMVAVSTDGRADFMKAVKTLPLTRPTDPDRPAYSLLDIEVARAIERRPVAERAWNEEAEAAPEITMSMISASADMTSHEFFTETVAEVVSILETLAHLEATIDARCAEVGGESITFRLLRDALEGMRTEIRGLGGVGPGLSVDENGIATDGTGMLGNGLPLDAGSIRGREDAYRMLAMVADYLQRIEPHSPAPYLIRRAISWGRLSLTDLLRELLSESTDLDSIYRLLGIRQEDNQQ